MVDFKRIDIQTDRVTAIARGVCEFFYALPDNSGKNVDLAFTYKSIDVEVRIASVDMLENMADIEVKRLLMKMYAPMAEAIRSLKDDVCYLEHLIKMPELTGEIR